MILYQADVAVGCFLIAVFLTGWIASVVLVFQTGNTLLEPGGVISCFNFRLDDRPYSRIGCTLIAGLGTATSSGIMIALDSIIYGLVELIHGLVDEFS